MKIGLDFNGVVADNRPIAARLAWHRHGTYFSPHFFKRHSVVGNGLTSAQYDAIKHTVYNDPEYVRQIEPIPGSLDFLKKLLAKHKVEIVSSVNEQELQLIIDWFVDHNIDVGQIDFKAVGVGNSKAQAVAGQEFYLDNDLHKLFKIQSARLSQQPRLVYFLYPNSLIKSGPMSLNRIKVFNCWDKLSSFLQV